MQEVCDPFSDGLCPHVGQMRESKISSSQIHNIFPFDNLHLRNCYLYYQLVIFLKCSLRPLYILLTLEPDCPFSGK
jgi:hypothetical protein